MVRSNTTSAWTTVTQLFRDFVANGMNNLFSDKKRSFKQHKSRARFKRAAFYAKAALRNPELRPFYEELAAKHKLRSPYLAAIKDYMDNERFFTHLTKVL